MSATEALDAYLESQLSSKTASSSIRAASKPQDQLKAAFNPQARPSKPSEGGSRLRNTSKGPLLKQGAAGDDERVKGGAIKAVWPPSPLNESDKRPLLANSHPAAARTAQQKPSATGSGNQADPLSKLKRLSFSRLRNASGASPRLEAGSETAQPDHFAAALEKLTRGQDAGKSSSRQHAKQQGAGPADSAKAAAVGSTQDSPGQQRRARWDPLADTEDRLALQRLTQRAAALSGHTSPTKVQSSTGDDKQPAEGAATFHSLSQSLFPTLPAGFGSKGQDSAQTQQAQTHQARESAQILNEVLSELRAAEERSQEQQQTATAPTSLMQAAHNEASALGAVTAWYRDVQQKHVAAGLGDDPIIASILPGSSRKLKRGEAQAHDKPQADSTAENQGGPLLQALMASLPRVPEMPKKAPTKLPVIQAAASSHQAPVTAQDPPVDFAAQFSGLAEDMPRLHRDAFLQKEPQAKSRASSAANSPQQPAQDAHQSILPTLQGVADAMPVKSPAAAVLSPVIASAVVAQSPQHMPSSVGRDLEMLQQRWEGFYKLPPAKAAPVPESQVLSGNAVPHHVMAGARPHQHSMRQQQHSSDIPHPHDETMYEVPAHSQMTISPTARPAADATEIDRQRRPVSAEDRAETGLQGRPISVEAPAVSPLSAVSPVVGTPVEYFVYSAPPGADVMPRPIQETADGSGFSYQAARSPGQQMLGKPPGNMPEAPYSHSSIRRLWGHPELKVGSPEPWAAGQGRLGPSWAEHDRIASAMLQSQPRSSPASLSDVHMLHHSLAPQQVDNCSRHAHALTQANVSHSAADYDRLALHGFFTQHSRSMGSGMSHRSRNPSIAPPGTASSTGCASNASHRAGILDALLADADEVEMHDMHVLPGGSGMLSHERYDGSSVLQLGLDAEAADLMSDVPPSRPGSSRASLVAHYVQRGHEAQRAASGQCRVPTMRL